ncbi:lysis protein [Arsenophonus nasoniae]|uniref:Lysis protein n=1 Tax=Arsenophonus nasoniae TaxID=638 RepID=A0AA95K603_9GAMM|nr:lysis protein [Arsenophonus nasoniae]WGM00922.1 lysis protein [Arsenophonus nasoniae]
MLWRPYVFIVVIIAGLILALVFNDSRYQTIKQNYQTLKQQYRSQIEVGKWYQQELEDLHQLDIQHTEELNNAKKEMAKLYDAVRTGNKRLRVKTLRETPQTAPPKSRYDETTPQLSEAAREDYFRLREMIVENEKQTEYLQRYIKTQCQFH